MIAAGIFLCAMLLSWIGAKGLLIHRKVASWPYVQGTIHTRTLQRMSGHRNSFAPAVRYRYDVAGQQYKNDRVYPYLNYGDTKKRAQRILDSLNDSPLIFYNSNDPRQSHVLPVPLAMHWFLAILGGLLLLLSFGLALAAIVNTYAGD